MAMTPPEYEPTDADEAPNNTVRFPVPEPQEPESLEDLLVMVQDARSQLRDLNSRLGNIASFRPQFESGFCQFGSQIQMHSLPPTSHCILEAERVVSS